MDILYITVHDKIAKITAGPEYIVANNTEYTVEFTFDEEWSEYPIKTARFVWDGKYRELVFTGNSCKIPAITGESFLAIGVYAGNLITTTPAVVKVERSILYGSPSHTVPTPDVWQQLIALITEGQIEGATFIPSVDEEGIISWTNNKGRENPEPQNIKGPQGDPGYATCLSSDETGNIEYELENAVDLTYLATDIASIAVTIPATIEHGFFSGINFKVSSVPTAFSVINDSTIPLKLLNFGRAVEHYELHSGNTAMVIVTCDGLNIYCNLVEV